MSVLDAAEKILKQVGQPLKANELTNKILQAGFWTTKGKTPEATVSAQLAVDIKRKGTASRFMRSGRGLFTLNPECVDGKVSEPIAKEKIATCSFTDAAERILEDAKGQPMHYRDITTCALEKHLLNTKGKTPEATMYAQILTETKRRKLRGDQPRFVILGSGMVGLSRQEATGAAFQVDQSNRKARKELLKQLKAMDPVAFEELINELLVAIGFAEVEVTSSSNDRGIDVRGTLVVGDVIQTRLAVQAKRWKNNVQRPIVQQVRGSLGAHEQGLIITTSDFSKGAREEAERPDTTPVGLMTGEQLVDLLVENEIGVERELKHLIRLKPEENLKSET